MMNYIAMYIALYLLHGPWKGPSVRGYPLTDIFPPAAHIPTIGNTHVHWPTLLLGIVLSLVLYVILNRTPSGFEIRVVGENPQAARFAGMSELKTVVIAMLISGGLAGLAGVGEVGGVQLRLLDPEQITMGYGYTAIIVAWLARKNPLAVIVTSFFFGVLMAGGDVIKVNLGLPFQLINVFNGVIMFFLIGSEVFMRYRVRLRRR
jgi:simple sugar transport system permease protein